MRGDFRFIPDAAGLDALAHSGAVGEAVQEAGELVADTARALARSQGLALSGEGIESIHAELHTGPDAALGGFQPEDDLPTSYVGWSEDNFYMGFAETGTEHQPPTPFLVPALDQTTV